MLIKTLLNQLENYKGFSNSKFALSPGGTWLEGRERLPLTEKNEALF